MRLLHAEEAELGRFRGCLAGGKEAHCEDLPGVAGVDDAVVPQPGARVVRMAFVLVLLEDRQLQARLIRVRPLQGAQMDA